MGMLGGHARCVSPDTQQNLYQEEWRVPERCPLYRLSSTSHHFSLKTKPQCRNHRGTMICGKGRSLRLGSGLVFSVARVNCHVTQTQSTVEDKNTNLCEDRSGTGRSSTGLYLVTSWQGLFVLSWAVKTLLRLNRGFRRVKQPYWLLWEEGTTL